VAERLAYDREKALTLGQGAAGELDLDLIRSLAKTV